MSQVIDTSIKRKPPDDAQADSLQKKQSKKLKKRKLRRQAQPVGVDVCATESGVRLRELQKSIISSLATGQKSDVIKVTGAVDRFVVVQVEGLGSSNYLKLFDRLPVLSSYPAAHPLRLPGTNNFVTNCYSALLTAPLSQSGKAKALKAASSKSITLESLVLTCDQLSANDYPSEKDLSEGFIELEEIPVSDDLGNNVVAIDCEMVETSQGRELARISVIDRREKVLLDTYVRPKNEITNYLTEFSGISSDTLVNVSLTLEDVQRKLKGLIGKSTIIVGHSLEHDLRVLKLFHSRVIDSAVCYQGQEDYRKSSLKHLAYTVLGSSIQASSGHDSTEDAVAALQLVVRMTENPAGFGHVNVKLDESICERLKRDRKRTVLIGCHQDYNAHIEAGAEIINESCLEGVVKHFEGACKRDAFEFAWLQLKHNDGPLDEKNVNLVDNCLKVIEAHLVDTFGRGNTLLSIIGVPDKSRVIAERNRKRELKMETKLVTEWDKSEDENLNKLTSAARQGLLFVKAC